MDKNEFAVFASALRTYYPREQILPNPQAMALWFNQLQDIPYNIASLVLDRWVASNKWSPSIADIRAAATEMHNGYTLNDWGEGWAAVMLAIRKYGMYNTDDAMKSFDPITRKCVERLGFINICTSENINADRANFRMIYEQLSERQKIDAQIPEAIVRRIEETRKQLALTEG